ncbi:MULTISPECIES: exodeoxyribonuclease VII small subunit [Desulfosporosinus]|uniref:Exodeoxyribonuclease 7 small subunit n=1 Tax=Desulfosporosinus nitroreducens TaxID=2018668 RepID=A0ABT8QSS5_9FIRM|nr:MULTISPECIES: exodeoxyribonuclease VII small subunit [Desulfosporosinus]MCO1600039.1 exodeoxyribonuclease VII small subunit [Desulfosporosinus nitroreducens]MCO5387977.1 exodeoxyribonuclease VII small subunit [Desulfosporosinus sp.]MDA8223212.1 exodeoxyribonuclease VII small subunit [Desulfitobacterium hafniense]MDO0822931.1 exodeoxyribonuclease VII small subunit [Desulfosporosinus nitroreducens]
MSTNIWTEDLFEQVQDKINESATEEPSLETGLQQLEMIVKTLEQKDLPLEKALSLFKEGIGLVQYCSKVLDQAEKQMEILLEGPDGQLQIMPASFDGEG